MEEIYIEGMTTSTDLPKVLPTYNQRKKALKFFMLLSMTLGCRQSGRRRRVKPLKEAELQV